MFIFKHIENIYVPKYIFLNINKEGILVSHFFIICSETQTLLFLRDFICFFLDSVWAKKAIGFTMTCVFFRSTLFFWVVKKLKKFYAAPLQIGN